MIKWLLLSLLVFIGTFWLGKSWAGRTVAGVYAGGDRVERTFNSVKGTDSKRLAEREVRDEAYFLKKLNQRVDVALLKQLLEEGLSLKTREQSNQLFPYELSLVLDRWGEMAPLQGIRELMKIEEGMRFLPLIFKGWARKDPEAAINYYNAHKEDFSKYTRDWIVDNIITEYAWNTPEKAFDWLQEQKQELGSQTYEFSLIRVIRSLRELHPERVPQYAKLLSETYVGKGSLDELGEFWAKHDPENTEWLKELPNDARIRVESGRIMALSGENFDELERMITQLPMEDQLPVRERMARTLLSEGGLDMGNKLNWILDTYLASNLEDLRNRIINWMIVDAKSSAAWVESLPPGEKKELMKKWRYDESEWKGIVF